MKPITTLVLLLALTLSAITTKADTIEIKRGDLNMQALQTGSYTYALFFVKTKESPAQRLTLVNINVEAKQYHSKPAIVVTQHWDLDTVVHQAYSVFDAKDFSTILHDTYWKRLGYSVKFDFEAKTVDFTDKGVKGGIPDSIKTKSLKDFNQSFDSYNVNWHTDLIVYQLLPYKEGRTFIINYYDPGFGAAEKVMYSVTGSDVLTGSHGEKIDCWVLNHNDPGNIYERFWIAKKTNEVLKEEDFSPRGYRYKIKLAISGE